VDAKFAQGNAKDEFARMSIRYNIVTSGASTPTELAAQGASLVCQALIRAAAAVADGRLQEHKDAAAAAGVAQSWDRRHRHAGTAHRVVADYAGVDLGRGDDDAPFLRNIRAGETVFVLRAHDLDPAWVLAYVEGTEGGPEGRLCGWVPGSYLAPRTCPAEDAWRSYDAAAQALLDHEGFGDPFTLDGQPMRFVDRFRYLGVTIARDGGWTRMSESMVSLARIRAESSAFVGLRHGDFAPDAAWYFWNAVCAPLLNNAVQVWSSTQKECCVMDTEITRAGCSVLGISRTGTAHDFVRGELKQLPTAARQDHLALRFFGHIARMPRRRAVKRFFFVRRIDAMVGQHKDCTDPQSVAAASAWCVRLSAILSRYQRTHWLALDSIEHSGKLHKRAWDDVTDALVKDTEPDRWRQRTRARESLGPIYWAVKRSPGREAYLQLPRKLATCVRSIARLRAGLVGDVHHGRWVKPKAPPRDARQCLLCTPEDDVSLEIKANFSAVMQRAKRRRRHRASRVDMSCVADPAAAAGLPTAVSDDLPDWFCTELALPSATSFAEHALFSSLAAGGALGDTLHILGVCASLRAHRSRVWVAVCRAIRRAAPQLMGPAFAVDDALRLLGGADPVAAAARLTLLLGAVPARAPWWPDWAEKAARNQLAAGAHDLLMRWEAAYDAQSPAAPAGGGGVGSDDDHSPIPPVPPLLRLPTQESESDASLSSSGADFLPPLPPLLRLE
jgi:hypothetical protein